MTSLGSPVRMPHRHLDAPGAPTTDARCALLEMHRRHELGSPPVTLQTAVQSSSIFPISSPTQLGSPGRPVDMKRRKTAPSIYGSPQTPASPAAIASPRRVPYSLDRRSTPREGDVWPDDLEEAFMIGQRRVERSKLNPAALQRVPKLGRRKILVDGKPCGRNELISIYLKRTTGYERSRKQVSSHIQVLKNLNKGKPEFMNLVSEPRDGEDNFEGLTAEIFGQIQTGGVVSAYREAYEPRHAADMSINKHFLAPSLFGSSAMGYRSLSVGASPLHSPVPSDRAASPFTAPSPMAAPMSASASLGGLANNLKGLHLPFANSYPAAPHPLRSLLLPSALRVWAEPIPGSGSHQHDFFRFDSGSRTVPSSVTQLAELPKNGRLYGRLEAMMQRFDVPFVHGRLSLSLPCAEQGVAVDGLSAELRLNSTDNAPLTVHTSIFSYGDQILSLCDALPPPIRVLAEVESGSSSPGSSGSPITPDQPLYGRSPLYEYDVPFGADFWALFLRGEIPDNAATLPAYSKHCIERSQLGSSVSNIVVLQEIIYRGGNAQPVQSIVGAAPDGFYSPASLIGEHVGVIMWDITFEDNSAPSCVVSQLRNDAPGPCSGYIVRSVRRALFTSQRPIVAPAAPSPPRMDMSPPPVIVQHAPPTQSAGGKVRRGPRGGLSVDIPPPLIGDHGQITPGLQVVKTPTAPPPIDTSFNPDASSRLVRHWAAQSHSALPSPALQDRFEAPQVPTTHGLQQLTAEALAAPTPAWPAFVNSVAASAEDGNAAAPPSGHRKVPSLAELALTHPQSARQLGETAFGDYFSSGYALPPEMATAASGSGSSHVRTTSSLMPSLFGSDFRSPPVGGSDGSFSATVW